MQQPTHWIIEKKRDGNALLENEIREIVKGYVAGSVPDYQMAALAMAIFFQGMSPEETAWLADAMMRSGAVMDWSDVSGAKVDKHSTGGVGDKTSLIIAPLAAACGLVVPMMSGRGLGLTGGTLDKLESIPGFCVRLSEHEIRAVLRETGCCMMGQTDAIAPADRKLYALRDVTATVPSIPLIVASIMSKKLAEGAEALVLDVKWGSGAFMKTVAEARALATALARVGKQAGMPTTALISNMNQPLGSAAGNAPEIREAIEIMQGRGPEDTRELSLELCGHMLKLGGVAATAAQGRLRAEKALAGGAALERFKSMILRQGGDARVVDEPHRLPQARFQEPVLADRSGYVAAADAGAIGRACVLLGAGRNQAEDSVDPAAGMDELAKVGRQVEKGAKLAVLRTNTQSALVPAKQLAAGAFRIVQTPPPEQPLVCETMEHEPDMKTRL